jgi:crotonobetainyl-CoA:carnitine CoA-transferase CaiB-like acyl-CoA transferase
MKGKQKGLLAGICILDLADEQGSFCSKLLADLGAAVIRIESPEGNAARHTTSFLYRNSNKLAITLDLKDRYGKRAFHQLIRTSDVLVESFHPGYLEALSLGYGKLRCINPRIIHLSITGFGQTGPKSAYHACDSVCAAFGGQMSVSGIRAGKPLKLFGPQSFYAASLFGANAVLLNLRKRRISGKGCYIDLSIQEAVASTLDHVLVDYFHDGTISNRQGDDYAREPFTILRCKDGYIQIPILRNWETLRELITSEIKAKGLLENRWNSKTYREKHYSFLVDSVEAWTRTHTKYELFELGQAMGLPWAPVESPQEVRKSPQLKARGFYIRTTPEKGGHRISLPGSPYQLRAEAGKSSAVQNDSSSCSIGSGEILRGIRVLDFTRMLSGPYATRILGDFGAEVIKIQSSLTATGAERNDAPGFLAWNRNKRSISLNLNRAEARELLLELVSISDVVVENFSPRVMANWGLNYTRLETVKPGLIMASISAMGQTGPWKNFVGFAPTFHALSGLTAATSRALDTPAGIGFAYGDIVTGLYAALAILASLENKHRTGSGQYIDLSGYEALCTLMAPADDSDSASSWGCYPCKGQDRWCVIAASHDAEWESFRKIFDMPELKSSRFSTQALRRDHREELDKLISQRASTCKDGTIVRRLQKTHIAAGVVQNAADLARDRQLAARRFFTSLRHPVFGKCRSDRSALWPWNENTAGWKAAPSFGEDSHYVLVELLGHSEPEFQMLKDKGIIESIVSRT